MQHTLPALILLSLVPNVFAAAPPVVVDYLRDVKPVLKERCFACHGTLQQKGGLRLDTAQLIRQGGDNGPAALPGEAIDSILFDRITTHLASRRMPRDGEALTPAQIDAIRAWITQGMRAPANEQPEPDPLQHWAFRKVVRPTIPPGKSSNPIDRFVVAEWNRRQLQPAPPADRPTLIRRVYLDLVGLPPTRTELTQALADSRSDWYERLVDRLLASPRYGERWGRHWMDVWRYSDWYGRRSVPDVLNSYGMIWRWRDWIVRSLNEDRPYDRMVQEMLAADELSPNDRESHVATGFLVRNFFRWNYNNWMRDNVEHTSKAFLGLTVQCAHCHDHKYDPISQVDYFRMRAVFEPLEIRHDRVPGEADPGVYPKYSYGAAYKPITSGMVRVVDEKLDAKTWMYSKGDERDRMPGKPPVPPGGLAAFGGEKLPVAAIDLPAEARAPGLRAFIQQEEENARRSKLDSKRKEAATARQQREQLEAQLTSGEALEKLQAARAAEVIRAAELAALETDWLAYRARLAADRVHHGQTKGDPAALAKAAARAEKLAAWQDALAKLVQQEQNLMIYSSEGRTAEIAKTEKQVTTLRAAAEKARAAIATAGDKYTPVGPIYPAKSTGRRLALARWITRRDNPLTARVAVNHVWNWHFGQPIVETTANFGRSGASPTHPELLDWLASELMDNGWHFKPLHRQIVTSQAYRLASTHPQSQTNRQRDPDNKLLWRFPVRRLEAEVVRDGLLHCAGELDDTLGGPEIAQDKGLTVPRRSLYFSHHGETRMAFLDLFDAANPNDCYRRTTSVRPQQALALTNSELPPRMARKLAAKLGESDDAAFVQVAFEQILSRGPTSAEIVASLGFLSRQRALFQGMKLTPTPDGPSTDPARRARENFLTALFNHTDFVTLR